MEGEQDISRYRDKLDKTLMSPDLSNVESLKILVENQMSKSTQSEAQGCIKRTKEVANSLSMLRSASGKAVEGSKANEIPHSGWKKVASVSKGDADFSKVLEEPFYGLIRKALYSENNLQNENFKLKETKIVDEVLEQETVKIGQSEEHCTQEKEQVKDHGSVSEIEEIEETGKSHEDDNDNNSNRILSALKHRDSEVGLASRKDETSSSHGTHRSSFSFVINEAITSTLAENNDISGEVKDRDESSLTHKKIKKKRFCCLRLETTVFRVVKI
ncbi:hypothetical protein L1987_04816 [Smallanthus sonchifolius]|uniref:Uncharacterized protein n=1 Tax=Smallanthus sonchifolius TaxID=185202 RepID=A0ACB9JTL1_9ASTR|nr:hypothetical protein L1987_04816 [Smallanthus sonchifolius]